jgi:nucleoid DNA-binding protein
MASKGTKAKATPKAITKTQMVSEISTRTGLTKAQVQDVLSAQAAVIGKELKAGHPAAISGLVKITLVHKPATAAHPGVNPFTKEEIMIKAKPARRVVRVRALKALKDMA